MCKHTHSSLESFPNLFSTLFVYRDQVSIRNSELTALAGLADQQDPRIYLSLPELDLQTGHTLLYMGARDPNSGPCVCTASTLPSDLSPGSFSLPFKRKETQDTMIRTYNPHTLEAEAEGLL